MTELKLGSLFDGIGGFPLAATMNDIRPVWASDGGDSIPLSADEAYGGYYETARGKSAGGRCDSRRLPLSGFIRGGQERGACRGEVRLIHGTGADCKRNEKTGQKEDEKP